VPIIFSVILLACTAAHADEVVSMQAKGPRAASVVLAVMPGRSHGRAGWLPQIVHHQRMQGSGP